MLHAPVPSTPAPARLLRGLLCRHVRKRSQWQWHANGCARRCSTAAAGSDAAPTQPLGQPLNVAVIGGGFAGLAVSWHLLAAARTSGRPMQLHLYDAHGLGAGGSGAAAGLLHPYTPRGKMLWRGLEAFQEATHLLEAAEAAAEAAAGDSGAGGSEAALTDASAAATIKRPLAWRHGMLRPARSAKQACDIARFLLADPEAAAATRAGTLTEAAELAVLVPGLQPAELLPPDELEQQAAPATQQQQPKTGAAAHKRRKQGQQRTQAAAAAAPALGLMVGAAVTIHPASYMHALWLACQLEARQAGANSAATLIHQPVTSLRVLQLQRQAAVGGAGYDAVVVAAGAAVGAIAELAGLLPLELCHGFSLDMRPAAADSSIGEGSSSSSSDSAGKGSSSRSGGDGGGAGSTSATGSVSGMGGSSGSSGAGCYPEGAPSLLGSPYIAAHGSSRLVVGATKRYGVTPAQALAQCSQPVVSDAVEAAAAAAELLPAAQQLWPPLVQWRVEAVHAGVRALPSRGSDGSIPYAGMLPPHLMASAAAAAAAAGTGPAPGPGSSEGAPEPVLSSYPGQAAHQPQLQPQPSPQAPTYWVIGGLGARGLVYHAWLGKLVAHAVLGGSDEGLPRELLRWRQPQE